MVRWTLSDTLAFLLLLSLLLPSLLIMFIPSTFKRPVSSWKALNLRKTLLMASSVRLKPLNCSRLPCVYAQETLTFLLTQKKTCVKNYRSEERFSRNAETDLVCRLLLEKKKHDNNEPTLVDTDATLTAQTSTYRRAATHTHVVLKC